MVKFKPYLRKSIYILTLTVLGALFVVLKNKQTQQVCEKLTIEIEAPVEKQLITQRLINDKISEWFSGGLLGTTQENLSLPTIEKQLEGMPAVLKAEVSFDLRGELKIQIEQRVPVVRIMGNDEGDYYIAKDFTIIPALGTDVARVPIANGRLTKAMIKKVYTLSTYVQENAFMEALTEQIFVESNGDLVIIPKIKNQRIIIGDNEHVEEKFSKLMQFYSDGLNYLGWDKYTIINLKYKDQIVCK